MSRFQIAMSASFPTSSEPILSSRNNCRAAQMVNDFNATRTSTDSSVPKGCEP